MLIVKTIMEEIDIDFALIGVRDLYRQYDNYYSGIGKAKQDWYNAVWHALVEEQVARCNRSRQPVE